jgi:3-oxoadipate enol-lactonase
MIMTPKPAIGRLGEIKAPTLIITGAADIPDVQAHAGAIEAGIPSARRVVMEGVGHILYLEKPAEFTRLSINFLEANQLAEPRQELRSQGD